MAGADRVHLQHSVGSTENGIDFFCYYFNRYYSFLNLQSSSSYSREKAA